MLKIQLECMILKHSTCDIEMNETGLSLRNLCSNAYVSVTQCSAVTSVRLLLAEKLRVCVSCVCVFCVDRQCVY